MKKKIKYEPPVVLESLVLELEAEILGASAVIEDEVTVETTGQEVIDIDMTGEEYYHRWE
jgi:hypothetical protein